MTPQESQMLNDLIGRVQSTRLTEKDPEAESLILDGLAANPDALYILAQTVLVQDIALRQAKAQIDQMRQQPAKATSFLSSLLHRDPPPAAQAPPQYQAQPQYQPVAYPPGPGQYGAPQYQQGPVFGQQPSFLRSAATTAAGVAAGALAFEGIESLLHGGRGGFGGGGGWGDRPMEETVINNYYDSPDGDRGDSFREHHEREASFDERPSDARLHDASYSANDDQIQGLHDSSNYDIPLAADNVDNVSLDDSSNFDDGGGDFGGGDDVV